MGQMTAGQVLAQVDDLLPNSYPGEQKRRWLRQAPAPYDGLYRHYVEAQIHYANGELERYNNAMALWNNGLMTLRDHWCRGHMPRRQARALRLC